MPGFKCNTDPHAALGIYQLARIAANALRRAAIWERYDEVLVGLPITRSAPLGPDTVQARYLYAILIDPKRISRTRDRALNELIRPNIGTGVHTLSLPLSAKLTDRDVQDVILAVRRVVTGQPELGPQRRADRE